MAQPYSDTVRHAVYLPPIGTFGDVHALVELAQAAESAGWDGFFLWDHILFEADVPMADPWVALAAIAATTSTVRLGPLVTPLPRRRPWKVAREAVTLDHLSRGRLVLGVGLGIDFWREYGAFGGEAGDDTARARLLDDGIEILARLWSGERITFRGQTLSVDDVRFLPRPLQQPRIPIWSAALWPLREGPARRAARCDGVVPFSPAGPLAPDEARALRRRVESLREQGGDFDVCVHVGRSAGVAAYEAAGVTWLLTTIAHDTGRDEALRVVGQGPSR